MNLKRVLLLRLFLLQIKKSDSSKEEMFEFGVFENFEKNKQIFLVERSVVQVLYREKGIVINTLKSNIMLNAVDVSHSME